MALSQQVQYTFVQVRMSALLAEIDDYANFPKWQRDSIWPLYRKRRLINSILTGSYVPPLVAYTMENGKYCILDGRQRMSTIEDFVKGKFTTAASSNQGDKYVEVGRYYSGLSEEYRNKFRAFQLSFAVLQETDERRLQAIYRDLQNLSSLTPGEIAKSFDNIVTEAAAIVAEHEFFTSIYAGERNREQAFSSAFYPLMSEMQNVFCAYDSASKKLFASRNTAQIGASIIETIVDRMYYAIMLFDGIKSTLQSTLIVMYQAVYMLQLAGYDIDASKPGCLHDWYKSIERMEIPDRVKSSFSTYMSHMYKKHFQLAFWQRNLVDLACQEGLQGSSQAFRNIEKIAAWLRNNEFCPSCGNKIALTDSITHDCTSSVVIPALSTVPSMPLVHSV